MSTFAKAVRDELLQEVARYCQGPDPRRSSKNRCDPSVPLNISALLPATLTDTAVSKVLEGMYEKHSSQEAAKLLRVYPVETLLRADSFLDKLSLINTPDGLKERVEAITKVVDLNRRLEGRDDYSEGMLGIMATYWNQIPLFFEDLTTTFDLMAAAYDNHPKLKKFRNWMTYDVRDGILDVAQQITSIYGRPYEEGDSACFGMTYQRQRRVLPDTSAEEFITELCKANAEVANNSDFGIHISYETIRKNAKDWKEALREACDKTIREAQQRR